jgi:hypothetical protein
MAPSAPEHVFSRWLFLRSLGVVFLVAFTSLGMQVIGLVGEHGIIPAAQLMANARAAHAPFWALPTLFWLSASNGALRLGVGAGLGLSLLLTFGVAQRYVLVCLWALYLSFVSVGDVFLGYQWDVLLIESAFFAALYAPSTLSPRGPVAPPSRWALRLLSWLVFRLMFMSGAVKLLSGDPAWANLSALQFHFWTQPLPTALGWYAAHLPNRVLGVLCAATFFIELLLPFFVFGPRRMRQAAVFGFVLLQVCIALTGNYGIFNLLTTVLCLSLLDDAALGPLWHLLRLRWRPALAQHEPDARPMRDRGVALLGAVLFAVSLLPSLARLSPRTVAVTRPLLAAMAPFATFNAYGLFAVMTKERDEIVVEGSDDGQAWRRYQFPWKPSELNAAPGWVEPFMPRVDWQMWFAALGRCSENAWFLGLSQRLLEGEPTVERLMAKVPFVGHPPRYLRSTRFGFRPEALAEKRRTGNYWQGEPKGPFCPVLTLVDGQLSAVR